MYLLAHLATLPSRPANPHADVMELVNAITAGLSPVQSCWPCCGPQITVVLQSPQGSPAGSESSYTGYIMQPGHNKSVASTNGEGQAPMTFATQEEAEAHARTSLRGAFLYKHR